MITGHGRIERLVRVWLPVGFFLVLALFPFYWMAITSIKPNAELYNKHLMPLLVRNPTLKHYVDLLTQTSFLLWTWNTMLVAIVSTAISLVSRHDARLSARPHAVRRRRPHRDDGGGGISRAAAAPLPAARRRDQPPRPRQHADLGDADLSDDAGAVLRLALARLFQDRAEGARGSRAHRRRQPAADDAADLSAVVHAGLHLGRDLRLHPVAERVSLCADLPDQELGAHGPGRGHRRTDPRRCVLLGPADGGSAAGLDPGRADLLLLRRALRRRADLRLGKRIGGLLGPPPPRGGLAFFPAPWGEHPRLPPFGRPPLLAGGNKKGNPRPFFPPVPRPGPRNPGGRPSGPPPLTIPLLPPSTPPPTKTGAFFSPPPPPPPPTTPSPPFLRD